MLALGAWLLARDVEGWNTAWFLFGWYGYLIALDAVIGFAAGHSFLDGRVRELVAMMGWSVPYWCLFEAYNLVLDNWHYVFVPRDEVAQALFAFLAFATVLPACFFHAELLTAWKVAERVRFRPRALAPASRWALWVFGLASIVLPLLAPTQTFWMIWGATFCVPALINRALAERDAERGPPSLLRDLERGDPRTLVRLLLGGLWAGGVWEGLNYPARAKWIYTVPGFEDSKLFEMPLLGFVGFPLLAISAYESYALWSHLARAGRRWERPGRQAQVGLGGQLWAMAAIVLFSIGASLLTLDPAVLARRPLLSELRGVDASVERSLRAQGWPTPERLCAAIDREGVAQVAARAQVPASQLESARAHASLALHKGMGAAFAGLLLDSEVGAPQDLATREAGELRAALVRSAAARELRPPSRAQVGAWIRGARQGALPFAPAPRPECQPR